MGSFSLNGVFSATPDPNYQGYGIPVRGYFLNGKPVRQGFESGTLSFPPMQSAMLNELAARYEANKNTQTSGAIPKISGYGWRAVSAYWHEPLVAGWDGGVALGVQMLVTKIGNY